MAAAGFQAGSQNPAFAGPSVYPPTGTSYGAAYDQGDANVGSLEKGTFLRGQRRRINVNPILYCILAPWALFTVTYAVLSFSLRYNQPQATWFVVLLCFLAVVGICVYAIYQRWRRFATVEKEPSWLLFLALTMLLAFVIAYFLGNMNYKKSTRPFFDMMNLNAYTDVYPNRMRGQQLMDSGVVEFTQGTKLDISKSMGFRNGQTYCVAPITLGTGPLASYDFWAVGTNCCSGNQADFHCPNFQNPGAMGGLRLMNDNARGFYRLAVQQAEATYQIKAVHPLFFEWVPSPKTTLESWRQSGRTEFLIGMFSYFVFQAFLVAAATLAFSKLGSY